MDSITNEELKILDGLVSGGPKRTAGVLRFFGALSLAGTILVAIGFAYLAGQNSEADNPISVTMLITICLSGVLTATILSAVASIIDLLRGIVAGVWRDAPPR